MLLALKTIASCDDENLKRDLLSLTIFVLPNVSTVTLILIATGLKSVNDNKQSVKYLFLNSGIL